MNVEGYVSIAIFGIFFLVLIFQSLVVVRANKRAVTFRLGRLYNVLRPGLHIIAPFLDKFVILDLEETIPNWQMFSEEQIDEKIRDLAQNKGL